MTTVDPQVGLTVTHRRYVPYSHAHYAGNLVDGAYALALFGDVATELCIRTDGDEGLFAGYSAVSFLAPIRAGDVVEIQATLTRVGNRSRDVSFECRVICRGTPEVSDSTSGPTGQLAGSASGPARQLAGSAATVLDPPLVAVTATGTVVVPPKAG